MRQRGHVHTSRALRCGPVRAASNAKNSSNLAVRAALRAASSAASSASRSGPQS